MLDHVRQAGLKVTVGSMHIDFEEGPVILKGVVNKPTPHPYPCVLHNNVEFLIVLLELPNNLGRHPINLLKIDHVQLDNLDLVGKGAILFNSLQL